MGLVGRLLRRLVLAVIVLALASTAASLIYNAITSGRDVAASKLYHGPYVRIDGTALAYRTWGAHGTPVVLIGGFLEASWVWRDVAPLLARTHRVYAVDLPPFGYSERRGPYTLARWTALVEAFDRHFSLRRPVLVGHSLGAAVAVSASVDASHDVGGIVLLDGDALPGGGAAAWLAHLLVPPWYTSLYRIATDSSWLFRQVLQRVWGPAPPSFDAAFVEAWQRPLHVAGTAAALASLLTYGIQGVSTKTLSQVSVPALVAWGAGDTVDSVASGRRTASLLHAPFVAIPRAGHLAMLSRPGAVAAAVERLAARP